jgi:hypothetical protein
MKYIVTFYDITSFKVLQLILFMILISNHLIAKPSLNIKVLKIYVYSKIQKNIHQHIILQEIIIGLMKYANM